MLEMNEADQVAARSVTDSKKSSSQGSGIFWKPMGYLTSSSEAGSSNASQHNMLPRDHQDAVDACGSDDGVYESIFFKPVRAPHFIFGDSSGSGSSFSAPRIQSHAARISKREKQREKDKLAGAGGPFQQEESSRRMISPCGPGGSLSGSLVPGLFIPQTPPMQESTGVVTSCGVQAAQILVPPGTPTGPSLSSAQLLLPVQQMGQVGQVAAVPGVPLQPVLQVVQLPQGQPEQQLPQPQQQQQQMLFLLQQQLLEQQQNDRRQLQQEQMLQQLQTQPQSQPRQTLNTPCLQEQLHQRLREQLQEQQKQQIQHMKHPPIQRGDSEQGDSEATEPEDGRPLRKAKAQLASKKAPKPANTLRLAQPLPVGPQDPSETKGSTVEELLTKVPTNEEGERTSLGSLQHPDTCLPCLFWFKGKCGKGVHCDYCHFRHPGQKNKRIRPSKHTRLQMRATKAEDEDDEEPAGW